MAEIPDWLIDASRDASPSARWLLVVVIRRSSPRLTEEGDQRAYLRLSTVRLGRFAGMNKSTVKAALHELEELGLVTRYPSEKAREPDAFVVDVNPSSRGREFRPPTAETQGDFPQTRIARGRNIRPPEQSRGRDSRPLTEPRDPLVVGNSDRLGGGGVDPSTDPHSSDLNNNVPKRSEITTALLNADVTDPDGFLEEFGIDQCDLALDRLRDALGKTQRIRNEAGWLRALLQAPGGVRPLRREGLRDSLEEHRRDYLGATEAAISKGITTEVKAHD